MAPGRRRAAKKAANQPGRADSQAAATKSSEYAGRGRKDTDFRIPVDEDALKEIVKARALAVTQVYSTLDAIHKDLKGFFSGVPAVLPTLLRGQLLNPDGSAGADLEVQVPPPTDVTTATSLAAWSTPRDLTDTRGVFSLRLPQVPVPKGGLKLQVRGASATAEITLRAIDVETAELGILPLPRPLAPLQKSVVAQLKDIVPKDAGDVEANPADFASPAPQIMLGEGDCARDFRSNSGVIDQFRYSLLIRLVPPQVLPKHPVIWSTTAGKYVPYTPFTAKASVKGQVPATAILDYLGGLGKWHWVDRVPIDRPIDTDAWRWEVEGDPLAVPKAATLGLGYLLRMHQVWIPAGLSLGDLVYSLPLAPGEIQRVAVYERSESLSVRESESLSIDEAQQFRESADSSTLAIFNSAYKEAASGGSSMETSSNSWSIGGATGAAGMIYGVLMGGGLAGGYGSSSSAGSSASWQQGSRDFASTASQDFHSALNRQAAASRRSTRTGMRTATAAESERVTTKVVANNNHCHALTMQYWEVLRHYAVSTKVDDAQLVAMVPMELIQFLPPGEPRTLPTGSYTRDRLLSRYGVMLHYHDVLAFNLQRRPEYLHGLTLLKGFAANPTMKAEPSNGLAQVVIAVQARGTFLPFEDVYVTLVTKTGARVGPIKLTPATPTPDLPANLGSAGDLLQEMRARRNATQGELRSASIVLPDYIARSDVARFELSRAFRPLNYSLKFNLPGSITFALGDFLQLQTRASVAYSAADLERELGGPIVWDIRARIQGTAETYVATGTSRDTAEAMPTLLPIPALRVPPILSFADLLRIEAVFQHVVRNSVTYSKAVWVSLTPEERAILLEPYTLGVPSGGLADPSQEVPLLDCIANEVLGYFGNAMVMPFFIPPPLADKMKVTSRDVQEALLKFHRQAFVPPQSSITLPTRGMLGEGVLGSCNSCEKIDLTRFWNWQDSPIQEKADAIKPVDFKGQAFVPQTGVEGPKGLTSMQGGGGNVLSISTGEKAPAPSSDLLAEMMKQMPAPTAFKDITGMDALKDVQKETITRAEEARKSAVDSATKIAETVINKFPEALKAAKGVEDKEAADTEAAKKKASDEQAARDKKTADDQKAGLDKLAANAAAYVGVANADTDQTAANTRAASIVQALFGSTLPGIADLAAVYDKFKVTGAADTEKQGKTAFLKALKLPGG